MSIILILLSMFISNHIKAGQYQKGDTVPALKSPSNIHTYFEKYATVFPNDTQIAVATILNEKVHYFGVIKKGADLIPIKNFDKVFEIGSITKVFTATLLSNMVHHHTIELNENIQDKLDIQIKGSPSITYQQLANHTSGIPANPSSLYWKALFGFLDNPFKNYSRDDLWWYLQKKLNVNPGKNYEYSNLGYGLLGSLMVEIEGASYEKMLQEKIFKKYNMNHSTTIRSGITKKLVIGLDKKGKKVKNWDFDAIAGAGAILSTVEDLAKFGIAQFNPENRALELTQKKTFKVIDAFVLGENQFDMDIGLGWHILTSKMGEKWHWHNGGTKGYHSSMSLDIKNQKGVVILSNVSVYHKKMLDIENLCFALMRSLKSE